MLPTPHALVVLLAGSLVLASSRGAEAQGVDPPTMVWGVQRGCEMLHDTGRAVQKDLEERAGLKPVYYLSPDAERLGCQGTMCAQQVRAQCPAATKGFVVGSIVQSSPDRTVTQARVWVHNLATGQTQWQDTYCAACSLSPMIAGLAGQMIQRGSFDQGPAPGPLPIYCQADPSLPERPAGNPKVYWVVYGKDHHRAVIASALRKSIEDNAGVEVPFEHIGRDYTPALLKKVLSKDPTAQVLGAQVQAAGAVQMFIYDGSSDKIEQQLIDCGTCDKDELAAQVKRAAMLLQSQCFGEKCVESGVAKARVPKLACAPFAPLACGDPKYRPGGGTGAGETTDGSEIRTVIAPDFARKINGLSWGAVALTGAATAGLFIANYAGAGAKSLNNVRLGDPLLEPAYAMAAATAVTLGIAIPLTILLDRAAPSSRKPAEGLQPPMPAKSSGLQCP